MNSQSQPIVIAERLTKSFDQAQPPVTAYSNISFTLMRGEFVCVVGPSGCGKTTLLRTLAGLEQASEGSCRGDLYANDKPPAVSMAFQDGLLLPWLTLADNVRLPEKSARARQRTASTTGMDWLRRLGLEPFAHLYPHQASGGMRQRANLARALAIDPEVLLLDEPFAFLDFQTRLGLQQVLLDVWQRESRTALFVTHDLEEAVTLADRIIVLTAHPGTVRTILPITLPRPREVAALRTDPRYHEFVSNLMALLPPSQIERATT